MRAVKSVTVVLPAYQVTGAMASTVRDLAVATYALRSRGIDLDVLLLHDGQDDVAAISTRAADDLGLSLTTLPGPPTGSGAAYLEGFRRVVEEDRADLVVTLDANGRHDASQLPHLIDHWSPRTPTWSSARAGHAAGHQVSVPDAGSWGSSPT